MLQATTPVAPICLTCNLAYGECRCTHQGRFITETIWVYRVTVRRPAIAAVKGWGIRLDDLKMFVGIQSTQYRPEFRQVVKTVAAALVDRFSDS